MVEKISWWKIIFETISELILIFTAAATGAVIGQGRSLMGFEWMLAAIFVLFSIFLKKISKII